MAKGVYSRTRKAECESRVFSVTSSMIFLFKEPMAFFGWLVKIYLFLSESQNYRERRRDRGLLSDALFPQMATMAGSGSV